VSDQATKLWHVSNLYRTEPAEVLATLLSSRFGGAQAFCCNSGAEAIEGAVKYARRSTGKPGVAALGGHFPGGKANRGGLGPGRVGQLRDPDVPEPALSGVVSGVPEVGVRARGSPEERVSPAPVPGARVGPVKEIPGGGT